MVGGPFIEGSGQKFTIGLNPQILGNLSKFCIIIIKSMENNGENFRKVQNVNENFRFFAPAVGKNKN